MAGLFVAARRLLPEWYCDTSGALGGGISFFFFLAFVLVCGRAFDSLMLSGSTEEFWRRCLVGGVANSSVTESLFVARKEELRCRRWILSMSNCDLSRSFLRQISCSARAPHFSRTAESLGEMPFCGWMSFTVELAIASADFSFYSQNDAWSV